MKNYRNSFFYSLSSKSRKIILIAFLFFASLILLLSRFESTSFSKDLRLFTSEISYQLSSFIITPVQMILSGYQKIDEIGNIYEDNKNLRAEQLAEAISFQELVEMKLKLEEYESILNIIDKSKLSFKTARIKSNISNNYLNSIILDAGSSDGIKHGMPILGLKGLIGFVDQVRNSSSVGILLSNINSRIPVSISDKSFQAIMIGQDINQPKVEFAKDIQKISLNDNVSTSGRGGIFPPYILIGKISSINGDKIRVKLLEDVEQLTHVRIIKVD